MTCGVLFCRDSRLFSVEIVLEKDIESKLSTAANMQICMYEVIGMPVPILRGPSLSFSLCSSQISSDAVLFGHVFHALERGRVLRAVAL